jgi:hypothetical protein
MFFDIYFLSLTFIFREKFYFSITVNIIVTNLMIIVINCEYRCNIVWHEINLFLLLLLINWPLILAVVGHNNLSQGSRVRHACSTAFQLFYNIFTQWLTITSRMYLLIMILFNSPLNHRFISLFISFCFS